MLHNQDIRAILRGAALPGIITFACGLIGFVYGFLSSASEIDNAIGTAKIGIFLGLFLSFFGFLEILGLIGLDGYDTKNWRRSGFVALGYLTVWAACIYLIFFVFR